MTKRREVHMASCPPQRPDAFYGRVSHDETPRSAHGIMALFAGFVIFLQSYFSMLLCAPTAYARSYTIDSVFIDASVDGAGSLSVREEREFAFDGSFNGVYWKIPTGTYQGREITTTITGVGEMIDGNYVAYEESTAGTNHSYELQVEPTYVQVKVYTAHENESARVVLSYTDTSLATRYDDTAELYWKFVSDGWDVESRNVFCTVHLPIPDGAAVDPGENVRAWGHGPLDATVNFADSDIVYTAPGVGSDEFAEARVVFPSEWMGDAVTTGTTALDTILAEEAEWADKANLVRQEARSVVTSDDQDADASTSDGVAPSGNVVPVLIALGVGLVAVLLLSKTASRSFGKLIGSIRNKLFGSPRSRELHKELEHYARNNRDSSE